MTPRADRAVVLDEDPDLGADLPADQLEQARAHSVARLIELPGAAWDPRPLVDQSGPDWQGLLVLDGLLIRRVCVGKRAAGEVFGPGDLLRPWDADGQYEPLPITLDWLILRPARLAVLDGAFAARMSRWPSVVGRLMGRLGFRARYLALLQAATHLPRTHARLLVLFWLLADRWGRVGSEGVTIFLPLTHETLSMLVGSNRPTVTVALGRLADSGLLLRSERARWLLTRRAIELLGRPESLAVLDGGDTVQAGAPAAG